MEFLSFLITSHVLNLLGGQVVKLVKSRPQRVFFKGFNVHEFYSEE